MSTDLAKGFRTLSLLTLVSRVLGMLRDMTLAALFGAGEAMAAFSVAFALPNLLRRLFGEGALSVAFIPVLTGLVEDGDTRGAARLSNIAITLLVTLLSTLVLLGEGFIALWALLGSPGPRLELTLLLAALMLPFVVTICLVALLQAILNVRGHFASPALAPIVLNVFIIAGAALTAPIWGENLHARIIGVAASVLAAGLAQVAIQAPALGRQGFRFRPVWDLASPHLRRVLALMAPMVIGLGIVQLNTFLDQVIAMGLSARLDEADRLVTHFDLWGRQVAYPMKPNAVAVMYYAQRLFQLPLGVFTIAIGTAIFPVLSRHAHRDDRPALSETLNRGLRLATFITVPCAAGLALVAPALVRVLFERGRFGADDAGDVALMTATYATGLLAYSVLHLTTRTFFARQDALTPVKASVAAAGLNLVLNLVLIWPFGVRGLAVSTVVAAAAQAVVLLAVLRRRVAPLGGRRYAGTLCRTLVATVAMVAAAWPALGLGDLLRLADGTTTHAVVSLASAVAAGVLAFLLAARLLRMAELSDVLSRGRGGDAD